VGEHWGADASRLEGQSLANGAGLVGGGRMWILVDESSEAALGPALAVADRAGASRLDLLVESHAATLARRAAEFSRPVQVWEVKGRELAPADPAPVAPDRPVPAGSPQLAEAIRAAGADVVVEGGVLRGTVLGLEVARAVDDGDGVRLEIGVGRHDRAAHNSVHPDPAAALGDVVSEVRRHRRPGVPTHPANQLAQERWLRSVLTSRPELVGASWLAPAGGSSPELGRRCPAPAAGTDGDGEELVVVCSTGVDPDLVPAAADVRLSVARPETRLAVVVPEGDDLPVTRRLAAALRHPAEVRTVGRDWREQA
jgi:hypothetical protein